MKQYTDLIKQITERPYKNLLFTVYNFAEDERYISRMSAKGYEANIDSYECVKLEPEVVDKAYFNAFKRYVEHDLQDDDIVLTILILSGSKGPVMFAVKPKAFDATDLLSKI